MRIFIIILFMSTLLGVSHDLEAQRIRGGFTLGVNASQVDGDEIHGFKKYGFHGGAIGTLPLKGNFLFTLETIYSEKGAYQSGRNTNYRKYRVDLDYVEVPFLLQYNDRDIFTIGAGLAFARLINVREWEKGKRTPVTLFGENAAYDRNDYLILLDLKFRLVQRLSMNIRYQYSLDKIRVAEFKDDFNQSTWERKQYNNNLTLRVAYMFNEPVLSSTRKEDRKR